MQPDTIKAWISINDFDEPEEIELDIPNGLDIKDKDAIWIYIHEYVIANMLSIRFTLE